MDKTKRLGRVAFSTVAGVTMVASMAVAPALANATENEAASPEGSESTVNNAVLRSAQVLDAQAQGVFAYSQTVITPNSEIREFFQRASSVLCGATSSFAAENPLEWQLSVAGDVDSAFTANVGVLAEENSVKKVMTCTCGGNPAGGRAIITAEVKGIPVDYLLVRAQAASNVNTATFISADGTRVAFPLAYLIGHHAVLSYEIGNEDLSASVGGHNQLWMAGTPANYFVRDVVTVEFTVEDTLPVAPGTTDEHPNSPNAGILTGSQR